MTIPLGRRRLILSFSIVPARRPVPDLPAAVNATDAELARLRNRQAIDADRIRWDAMATLYGCKRG